VKHLSTEIRERKKAEERLLDEIVRRERVEQELRTARERADDAKTERAEFLRQTTHDLRSPLSAVIGYSEMLTEDARTDGLDLYVKDLNHILVGGHHLMSMIDQAVDLARIEAGGLEVFAEPFTLGELLKPIHPALETFAAQHDNAMCVDLDDPDFVMTQDAARIRQILTGLVDNAAKHTRSGTVTLGVARVGRGEREWVRFDVADDGDGIPTEFLDAIFEPYVQVDGKKHGTGLGLYIFRELALAMGGTLIAASEPGLGSIFTLQLPIEG